MENNIYIIGDTTNDIVLIRNLLNANFNIKIVNSIDDNTFVIGLIKHAFTLLNNIPKNNINIQDILKKRKQNINTFILEQKKRKNKCILIKYEDLIDNYYLVIKIIAGKFNLKTKNNYTFKSNNKKELLNINTLNLNKYKNLTIFNSLEDCNIVIPPELQNVKINEIINSNYLNLYNKLINLEFESKLRYFLPEEFAPDVCFFHIEKCMGTSIRIMLFNYFKNIYRSTDIYIPEDYNNLNLSNLNDLCNICSYNNNFKVLLCHCSYNKRYVTDFSNYCYSITCLREPVKRFISHYYYFIKTTTKKNIQELNIEELKKIVVNNKDLFVFRLSGDSHNLDIALENIKKINCILIQETINDDLIYYNNLLNKKYNITEKMYCNNLNPKKENYNETSDYEFIKKHFSEEFKNDYLIYNTVINMKIEDRIK